MLLLSPPLVCLVMCVEVYVAFVTAASPSPMLLVCLVFSGNFGNSSYHVLVIVSADTPGTCGIFGSSSNHVFIIR